MIHTNFLSLGSRTIKSKHKKCALRWIAASAFITVSAHSFAIAPTAPASITAPSNTNSQTVALTWTSVPGVTYVLEQQKNGGSWTTGYSGSAFSINLLVNTSHEYGIYYFRVKACNGTDCSDQYELNNKIIYVVVDPDDRKVEIP